MELQKKTELDVWQELDQFTKKLNEPPNKDLLKVNKMANNSKYLPIGQVERLLDKHFNGLWQTENFKHQVVVNEIIGSID